MRFIVGLIGRGVLLAFGLTCLWYGSLLTGVGSKASSALESLRLQHPFQDTASSEKVKLVALLIGFGAAGCAVFPWSRVLAKKTPKTPRPPESRGSRGPHVPSA